MGLATTDLTVGSSPLTRGKLFSSVWEGIKGGLIPAHAGKTTAHRPNTQGRGAHPRSRGENAALDEEGAGVEGSSPLTRGKRGSVPGHCLVRGLIPAHAGKTIV